MIRLTLALIGSIVTSIQSLLIFLKGNGICFNNGCEVVESLTTVSPLIFNIVGAFFFLTLFCVLLFGRKGSEFCLNISKVLLHAALCAEAVLVFFQYQIANTFCSYCLIILSFIVLLNLLSGLRQIIVGAVLFVAILVAGYSLHWQGGGTEQTLKSGSIAFIEGQKGSGGGYLFFSKNCKHCEAVIELLAEDNNCDIRFNPIDKIPNFSYTGAIKNQSYNPQVNLNFLKLLSIKEIPVFVSSFDENVQILQGELQIRQYLQEFCQETKQIDFSGSSSITPAHNFILNGRSVDQDGCLVTEDCTESQLLEQSAKSDVQK